MKIVMKKDRLIDIINLYIHETKIAVIDNNAGYKMASGIPLTCMQLNKDRGEKSKDGNATEGIRQKKKAQFRISSLETNQNPHYNHAMQSSPKSPLFRPPPRARESVAQYRVHRNRDSGN